MIDVLTLVHGRHCHLLNMIRGLEQSVMLPDSLVIVQMNERAERWESSKFPIIHCSITSDNNQLPLATARNVAADHAQGDNLVFLDVDCVPAFDLLLQYHKQLAQQKNVLYQGEVFYLPAPVDNKDERTDLELIGAPHALHAGRQHGDVIPPELFWSLNFACRHDVFERAGRFDTKFCGYGAEDTDFSFRAAKCGISIEFVKARAYHQWHTSYDPPLNHLVSIIANAKRFKERWGTWAMVGWLKQFANAGYITIDDDKIVLLRLPTDAEIAAALC